MYKDTAIVSISFTSCTIDGGIPNVTKHGNGRTPATAFVGRQRRRESEKTPTLQKILHAALVGHSRRAYRTTSTFCPALELWTLLDRIHIGHFRIFDLFHHLLRSPETGDTHDFYVIDAPDWVNVIPITPGGQVVCVRQYRAGTDEVTLEVPGGMVDPEDDDPVAAARREMREETGYCADRFESLGVVTPNPAIQNNRCHTICAWDAYRDGPQRLDGSEVIDVELVDLNAIPSLITDGRITHSLVIAAFYLLDRSREPSAT